MGKGGLTRVKMTVKVDDGNRPVRAVDRFEEGKCNGVIAAKCDDAGERLALQGEPLLLGVRSGSPRKNAVVSLLDLMESPRVVVAGKSKQGLAIRGLHLWESHDVTGMSPQSRTLAQLWNGFVARGTLYPPLSPMSFSPSLHVENILEIQSSRTLSDARWAKSSAGPVGRAGIERGTLISSMAA